MASEGESDGAETAAHRRFGRARRPGLLHTPISLVNPREPLVINMIERAGATMPPLSNGVCSPLSNGVCGRHDSVSSSQDSQDDGISSSFRESASSTSCHESASSSSGTLELSSLSQLEFGRPPKVPTAEVGAEAVIARVRPRFGPGGEESAEGGHKAPRCPMRVSLSLVHIKVEHEDSKQLCHRKERREEAEKCVVRTAP